MQQTMLSCFFPTTVVFIDDNRNYLDSLVATLNIEHTVPKLFSNPIKAVEFINQQRSMLQRSFLTPIEEQLADHAGFDIDIRDFHQTLLNKPRFTELTVVVCDYAMPQQNGLETLQALQQPGIKSIMLTGEADEHLAIEAFNKGLIHQFIRKNTNEFTKTLNSIIYQLQLDYFKASTGLIIDNLIRHESGPHPCFTDPAFIQAFQNACAQHKAIEYYLLDEHGSYLLINLQGKACFFAAMDTATLNTFAQFSLDQGAPDSITQALQSQQTIPFFYSPEDLNTPPQDWDAYLHPATKISGQTDYFYALIPADTHLQSTLSLESYQRFLEDYQT